MAQHGLQTAHCVSEMSLLDGDLRAVYEDWAENHKTIIICNGGNTAMLEDLFTRLIDLAAQFRLPLVKFYEDEQSLNGALTSVAIILPEWAYDVKFFKGTTGPDFYSWNHEHLNTDPDMPGAMRFVDGSDEFKLISTIKSYRLA